jgi:butyrate kinase
MNRPPLLLVINIGSTSSKIALFLGEEQQFLYVQRHTHDEIAAFSGLVEKQYPFRRKIIMDTLAEKEVDLQKIDAVVGRGGLIKPVESGTYRVNDLMYHDLSTAKWGNQITNLGGIFAYEIARDINKPAYIVDPIVVNELDDLARFSGYPGMERKCIWHALNQKAVAKNYAREIGRRYEDLNLIVAHLGGGISVGSHKKGRVIDVNNALDGDGPFSAERPGGLPVGDVMRLCFSGKFPSYDEMRKEFISRAGLIAYLGTNDGREVVRRIGAGDEKARLVYRAMAYQISKEIGAASAVLCGEIDAVIPPAALRTTR